jgi:hypothetical protein
MQQTWGKLEMHTQVSSKNLKGRHQLEDLVINVRDNIKIKLGVNV